MEEIEARPIRERIVKLPDGRGLMAKKHLRVGEGSCIVVYRMDPATVIRVLRGENIEEIALEDGDEVVTPSWLALHANNHIGVLAGPGGPGKIEIEKWFKKSGLFGDEPIFINAVVSQQTYAELIQGGDVQRVNLATFRVAPEQTIDIDDSVIADVSRLLRQRLGDVSFELSVRAIKKPGDRFVDAADSLKNEVATVVQSQKFGEFAAARFSYDTSEDQDQLADLLEAQVAATVSVRLAGRGTITDAAAADALIAAYEQAQGRLTPALSPGGS